MNPNRFVFAQTRDFATPQHVSRSFGRELQGALPLYIMWKVFSTELRVISGRHSERRFRVLKESPSS